MKKLLIRDLMYLYTAVFLAEMRNLVTQNFFDEYYPAKKETFVAFALFFSTLCTMFGIMASSNLIRRNMESGMTKSRKITMTLAVTFVISASFTALFFVKNAVVYIIIFSAFSFFLNFMYNIFDVFMSGNVSPEEKEKNVRILVAYQMMGYIVGPLLYSFLSKQRIIFIVISILLLLVCFFPVSREYVMLSIGKLNKLTNKKKSASHHTADVSTQKNDKLVMLYSFMMFCAINSLTPSIAYLVKDFLKVEDYTKTSSYFLAGTVIVSVIVIVFIPAVKNWQLRTVAPISFIIAIIIILTFKSSNAAMLAVCASFCGLGNGIFLAGSRYYVSSVDAERGLVAKYNKIMTVGTLFGFTLTAIVSWYCIRNNTDVVPVKLLTIMFIFIGAVVFSLLLRSLKSSGEKSAKDAG